jgi:hypothetical protein
MGTQNPMETDQSPSRDEATEDQDVAEFKEEIENDPSTASPGETDDTDLDRLRGG